MISYALRIGARVNVRTDLGGITELYYQGALPARNGGLLHFVSHSQIATAIRWSVPIERIAPVGYLPNGQPTESARQRLVRQISKDKDVFAARFDRVMRGAPSSS